MTNPAPVKCIAVLRDGGGGRVLTISGDRLRGTIDHEARIGSTIIGEYTNLGTADRAAQLAERSWRRLEARKSAS